MKIVICDDNKSIASFVEECIEDMNIPNIDIEVFYSGNKLVEYLERGNKGNIYFLDIEMDGLNGIDLGRIIRSDDNSSLIIYMTMHKDYVFKVFEALPFRFLVKPLVKDELLKVMKEALDHIQGSNNFYFFKIERTNYQIPYKDIIYFEGRGRKACIHTKDGEYEFYSKISDIYEELDQKIFLRVHNSYIVNMDYIRSIEKMEVVLSDDITVPISRSYRAEVGEKHMKYIVWKSGV